MDVSTCFIFKSNVRMLSQPLEPIKLCVAVELLELYVMPLIHVKLLQATIESMPWDNGLTFMFVTIILSHNGLDAAIVFAPADIVTDTAIKSVKKGGTIVIATIGERPEFIAFEEKTIRGTLIGSTKDMEQVIKICNENDIEVIYETFPLEEANEALKKLKDSEVDARAVLVPSI